MVGPNYLALNQRRRKPHSIDHCREVHGDQSTRHDSVLVRGQQPGQDGDRDDAQGKPRSRRPADPGSAFERPLCQALHFGDSIRPR